MDRHVFRVGYVSLMFNPKKRVRKSVLVYSLFLETRRESLIRFILGIIWGDDKGEE